MSPSLPDYHIQLEAFHRAFADELRAIVSSLPLSPTMQVLDVGCGDGFYSQLLAERLSAPGRVTGLDSNPAYLDLARRLSADRNARAEIDWLEGKLEDLAEQDRRWDMVWCAQSLYSLPEPVAALAQMARLVRPGGLVVVLENDTLHQLLLPWPTELEIALRTAELAAFSDESDQPAKYYVGRRLPAVFAKAGLEPVYFRTQCIDRRAPLDPHVQAFLELYLLDLLERTQKHLTAEQTAALTKLIDATQETRLLRHPHFTLSWLNVLAWGRRP